MQKRIMACLVLPLLVFPCLIMQGQEPQEVPGWNKPLRVEIPARSDGETYRIIPVDSTGILLYFRSVEILHDTLTKWYFSLYDRNLGLLWIKSVPVRTGLEFRDYDREKDKIAFLFLAGEKAKGITNTELILTLDCQSGKFSGIPHVLAEGSADVIECRLYRDNLFIGYNVKSKPAHLQVADLRTGKISDHPLSLQGSAYALSSFILDTVSATVYAAVRKPISKNFSECILLKLSSSGAILSETAISAVNPGYEVFSPQLILTRPDELLVVAMFATAKSKSPGKGPALKGSAGFYTCTVKNGNQADIRFRTFLELNCAERIIGEKDYLAVNKKAMKKNHPAIEYAPELNILPHSLIPDQDGVIFLGESYSPEYHSENLTEFDFYGRPYINTYSVFDGYRYTNAIVTGFDRTGNPRWDNSMEIRNLISTELKPKVNLFFSAPETIVLCYTSEGRIASKIISGNKVVEKLDFSAMDLVNPEDKMISDSKNNMLPWYGPYFICYGYQEIKNINSSDTKRLVYYFTKVRFE
jgi:hypothetical protein